MERAIVCAGLVALLSALARGQSSDALPRFEIADVHVSASEPHHFFDGGPPVNGRFEIHSATMVELIHTAWAIDSDKIFGGPSWIELDRYDVIGKLPATAAAAGSTPASEASSSSGLPRYLQMLQSTLADRFKLVVRRDVRTYPGYVLTTGRKPLLRVSDGGGETGCKALNSGPLVPGTEIQYSCHNFGMETFASLLGRILGGSPVVDHSGLTGLWNADFSWQLPVRACPNCGVSAEDQARILETLEKQLGLKLESQPVPIPVIVVESVNRTPADNPPGVAAALPPPRVPAEFEVAVVKPTAPDFQGSRATVQPGGRVVIQGMTLHDLLMMTLGSSFGIQYPQWIAGMPDWAQSERFDITGIAPGATTQSFNNNGLQPLLRSLLEQRFGLKTHTEEREVPAYVLIAVKPKMKKADPASRAHCLNTPAPQGTPAGTVVLTCQNIRMDDFAEKYVRNFGTVYGTLFAWPPVLDATGLEGGWDFTLTYVQPPVNAGGRGRDDSPAHTDTATASDPGGGLTVTEAVEKQLGLKLELRKRPMPIHVIDHLERKPTDN